MRVTLLMTARERHGLTLACVDGLAAKTQVRHRLLFAHGDLPSRIEEGIRQRVQGGRMEARKFLGEPWPQHLRRAALADVDTEYVAFIDNDIQVSPGWLERLLECADATRAGAVGPVYLWGDGAAPPTIHMAGGRLNEVALPGGGRLLEEEHRFMNEDPRAVLPRLTRSPCDSVEFHCMLMPTAVARDPEVLDPGITCVHEHIDVALTLRRKRLACMLEPAAQVTYLAHAPFTMEDLAFTRWRWNASAVESSISAFGRKWNVPDDPRSFGGVRMYVEGLRTRYDPLRVDAAPESLAAPVDPAQLSSDAQGLMRDADAHRYRGGSRGLLERACALAPSVVDVQPAMRAASACLRYEFKIDIVLEAMLQGARLHSSFNTSVSQKLASLHPSIERRVRDFAQRARRSVPPTPADASPRDAEIAVVEGAIAIANGKLPAPDRERVARMLDFIGVPGMARSLPG